MPFYPSPNRDDGYDITDYYAVDPRLGSLGDFVAFIRTAKDRGHAGHRRPGREPHLRPAPVVPRRRGRARQSPFRDYYVWGDEPPRSRRPRVVFPDAEDSIWAYDEKAGQWYLHHFYSHQPDLNIANPPVRDEIAEDRRLLARARRRRVPGRRGAVPDRDERQIPATSTSTPTRSCATCARSSAAAGATRCCSAR